MLPNLHVFAHFCNSEQNPDVPVDSLKLCSDRERNGVKGLSPLIHFNETTVSGTAGALTTEGYGKRLQG